MDSPLSKADLVTLRKQIAALKECEPCLQKAEAAGLDCQEIRARLEYEQGRLSQLYQTYGSTYPGQSPT